MGSNAMLIPRRLVGKVAVVTASTQGIGLGIMERLGLEGASILRRLTSMEVYIIIVGGWRSARDQDRATPFKENKNVDEAVAQLQAKGIEAIGVACHVSKADLRQNLIKTALDGKGDLAGEARDHQKQKQSQGGQAIARETRWGRGDSEVNQRGHVQSTTAGSSMEASEQAGEHHS
ncbi:unnamed protein product [Calypogeia fissa]